jgi:hypothetical protein
MVKSQGQKPELKAGFSTAVKPPPVVILAFEVAGSTFCRHPRTNLIVILHEVAGSRVMKSILNGSSLKCIYYPWTLQLRAGWRLGGVLLLTKDLRKLSCKVTIGGTVDLRKLSHRVTIGGTIDLRKAFVQRWRRGGFTTTKEASFFSQTQ